MAINGSLDHKADMTSTLHQRFTRGPAAVSAPTAQGEGETTNDLTIGSPNIVADRSTRTDRRRIGDQECLGRRADRLRRRHPGNSGVFQFFQGLAAVIKGGFYVVAPNNIYQFSVSGWGWIHLILGIVLAATGFFILTGQPWARVVGIVVAVLSALSNFLFIPYYPLWALVIIALDVAVIWALSTYRPES